MSEYKIPAEVLEQASLGLSDLADMIRKIAADAYRAGQAANADLLEMAWVIVANANGGNWQDADPQWRTAAERWRDRYHQWLDDYLVAERSR